MPMNEGNGGMKGKGMMKGGAMKDGSRMSMPSMSMGGPIMPGKTDSMRQTKTQMSSMPTMGQTKGSAKMGKMMK